MMSDHIISDTIVVLGQWIRYEYRSNDLIAAAAPHLDSKKRSVVVIT